MDQTFITDSGGQLEFQVAHVMVDGKERDEVRVDLPSELPRAVIWTPVIADGIQVRVTLTIDGNVLNVVADSEGALWDPQQAPRLVIAIGPTTATAKAVVGDMDETGDPKDSETVQMLEFSLHEFTYKQ